MLIAPCRWPENPGCLAVSSRAKLNAAALGAQATFPMIFFVGEKKKLDLQAPPAFTPLSHRHPRTNPLHRRLVLHLALAPRTQNWCGESTLLRAGPSKPCSSACFFNSFAPSPQKIKRMRFSSFNVYLRTVQECFEGHSLQLYLRGRETLSKPAPDDAFSSRTAAYPVVSLTRWFDSLANGVPLRRSTQV